MPILLVLAVSFGSRLSTSIPRLLVWDDRRHAHVRAGAEPAGRRSGRQPSDAVDGASQERITAYAPMLWYVLLAVGLCGLTRADPASARAAESDPAGDAMSAAVGRREDARTRTEERSSWPACSNHSAGPSSATPQRARPCSVAASSRRCGICRRRHHRDPALSRLQLAGSRVQRIDGAGGVDAASHDRAGQGPVHPARACFHRRGRVGNGWSEATRDPRGGSRAARIRRLRPRGGNDHSDGYARGHGGGRGHAAQRRPRSADVGERPLPHDEHRPRGPAARRAVPNLLVREHRHTHRRRRRDKLQIFEMEANRPTPWMGLEERVNIYATMLWVAALARLACCVPKEPTSRGSRGVRDITAPREAD